MIEADKMLHLNRYVKLLRIGTKSRVARLHLRSSSCEATSLPSCRGYIFRYAHHGLVQKMHLRTENYAATCIKTFSTTVPQTSVDEIDHKVTSLCDEVKNGRVSADGLKEVIKLCNESDYQLHHSTGVLLLKCCGNLLPGLDTTERQHLADQVWHLMKRSKELTVESYNALLDIHMDNSSSVNPKEFLGNMSVEPNEDTYCLLLNIAIKTNNSKYLQDIMSLIKEKDIALNEKAFNALIQMYAASGNTTDIERIITLMQKKKLSTDKAYTELACGYAKLGDIPNLVKILNDEPQNDANLLKIIRILTMSNNSRHITVVLNFLNASVSHFEISKIITELIRTNQIVDAHTIISCLATKDMTKDIAKDLANSFLNELVILNLPVDDVTKYASDFVDSGCEPLALTNLAEIGLKLNRENLCFATFQMMRDKGIEVRPHYYWPLLVMAHCNKGEVKILSLVKSMMDMGVEMDSDTLMHFVYPYMNTVNPTTTMQKLLLNGVPSSIAFTPLISFLLSQNRLQDIILYYPNVRYKAHCKDLIKPLVRAYLATRNAEKCVSLLMMFPDGRDFVGLFLKSLFNNLNFYIEDLQCLLKEFDKYKVKILQRDAKFLKERLLTRNFTGVKNVLELINSMTDDSLKDSVTVYHPMYMNTKELNYALVESKSKGLNTKTILRYLLEAYCRENNFKKCEEIKQEFDACQYKWTSGIKIILFEVYVKSNKLKEAEELLNDIQSDEFLIDKFKIVMFANALVKAGEIKKAFEVLENTKKINMKLNARKYCFLLMETLAQSQYHTHAEDMLNLLLEKNYCDIKSEMLRSLIRIPLERNNIPAAIDAFTRCVQKYKDTPLSLELLITLLQQRDKPELVTLQGVNKYIEQVYDMISTIHSIETANTQLAIALASLNKTQELQNILQNHKLSMLSLQYNYTYLQRNYDIDSLFTLFKMIPDTSNLDKIAICEFILSFYDKKGNSNGVLELWKTMCAKNVKPSKYFERMFTQHLLLNKIPFPPEFEQDKSEVNVSN